MSKYKEFQALTDAEDYFDFFELEYDERTVYVKRFHILKKYGEMIEKGKENVMTDESKLLDFYKFALISVYKNFENGYTPSAADVWSMYDNPSACGSCSTSTECNDVEEVTNGTHSCTSQPSISFN
ncbi:MAG: nitrogenase-stabilizing/protective protein [Sulfurimonas sp.]|jgi:nitrogenase-stabilizing/protective protein|uniref:nitrogenase-stabilizing/protective protein NifW n=1 Tax=Sulfurimonas sp. TaxID=2022749 RepID=UPI0039E2EE56